MENIHMDSPIDQIDTGICTNQANLYNFSYTFLCLLDGEVCLEMDGQVQNASGASVFFIPPDSSYLLKTEDSAIFFEVSFNYLYIEKFLGYQASRRILCRHGEDDPMFLGLLASIAGTWLEDPQNNRIYLNAQILAFFHYLKSYHMSADSPLRPEHLSEKQFHNLQKITAFIRENYTRPLTLASLAGQFDMTPQYLASFFKHAMKETVFEYLADVRLRKAFDYVNQSDETPFSIAAATGFPNLGAFTKAFAARFSCSPEQWRADHPRRESKVLSGNISWITSSSLAKDYISNYVPLRQDISPALKEKRRSESYTIPILPGEAFDHPWTYLVNLGYTHSFMHADYRRQLSRMQHTMQFKYGRILRPFDIVEPVLVDGQELYDFSKIFQVLDFMQQIGLIPFIELGNKLNKINLDAMNRVDFTNIQEAADYYERLFDILPVFLRQCINRYGLDTVSQWQFELWTEHVHIAQGWGWAAPEVYARYFARLCGIIKEVLPDCRVGGPGYNTYAPVSHFATIMEHMKKEGCLPDFISAYIYPYVFEDSEEMPSYDYEPSPPMLSPDQTIFLRRLNKIRDFCNENYPQIKDLVITEYACEVSSRNFINDSIYQATFIAKFNLDALGLARGLAYWLISDIPLEYKDSNRILFGGNGLINRNGIDKPGFHAAHFLKDMGSHLVSKGTSYLLTRTSQEHFQLLLYNYAHMHEDFCRDNTSYASLKNPTAVFEPMEPRDMALSLAPLEAGTYRIRHYTINNDHANLLNEWIRLGAPENLSRSDIEYLQGCSWPHQELYFREIRHSLEISCHLQPQEVDLYLIDKIV